MSCLNLPELEFDEWGESLLEPLNRGRYPLAGEIELTDRCNLSCVHCFINQPASSVKYRNQELSTDQVKDILDQIASAGCLNLLITGGEPLLRPDFSELYLHARRNGLLIMLFTNATLLTPAIVDVLKDAPPILIEVTMYGATKATYEAVTRLPGSFERFMHGLGLLQESRLPLALKSVLIAQNKYELPMMMKMAEDMGLRFRYDGSIFPRLCGDKEPFKYRLSIEEMLELDRSDNLRSQEWALEYENTKDKQMRHEKYVYSCGAGHQSFHIGSTGRMSLCVMARNPSYSIPEIGFKAAWEKLDEIRRKERKLNTPCLTCSAAGICAQCPGWSQLVHGDDESIVDFICQLSKAREKENCYNISENEERIYYG